MTDEPPTDLGTIVVIGQRRQASGLFPSRGGGGGGSANEPGGPNQWELEEEDPQPPEGQSDPCADPDTAREWNGDAAAGQTVKDLRTFAKQTHPAEANFNDREYGAALWEMPDGSVVHGPMTCAELTFLEVQTLGAPGGRATVSIDLASPAYGAVFLQ